MCLKWNATESIALQKTENGLPCSVNIFPQDTYTVYCYTYARVPSLFLTITGIYTQLFENNQHKLKLLEEWQLSINCHFLVMERKHIVYAMYDRNMANCYAYTLAHTGICQFIMPITQLSHSITISHILLLYTYYWWWRKQTMVYLKKKA